MKKIYSILVFLLTFNIYAQAPQGFNYQATVRNNSGALMVNQNVTFKFNVIKDTPTSVPVFSETHYAPTDDLGAVNLIIGKGTATSGTFSNINWATGTYYLGIELNTGNGFVAMGTTQLLSVPFALYAQNSGVKASNTLQDIINNGNSATLTLDSNKTNAVVLNTSGGNTANTDYNGFQSTITGANGRNYGINGKSIGVNDYRNFGVVGQASNALKLNAGVQGLANSTTGHNYAVWGVASNAVDNNDNRGVMGYATTPTPTGNNYGVTGWAGGSEKFNIALGGYADAANSTNGDNYGVSARASAKSDNGTNYGVYATAANGAKNYAGFFIGDVKVNGNLDVSNKSIKNILNPVENQDAATKAYVDGLIGGSITADANRNIAIGTKLETVNTTTAPGSGTVGEYIPFDHTPTTSSYGKDNLSISIDGLKKLTTGRGNIAIGSGSLKENTTAAENTAVGYYALSENVSNGLNTAFGSYSLMKNTDWANTAFGHNTLTGHVFGYMNVAMGNGAMQLSLDRNSNTAIGGDALRNGQYGDLNTAVGIEALMFNGVGLNSNSSTNGSYEATHNTGVGAFALRNNTLGMNNSSLGFNALRSNTTGVSNTALGADSSKNSTTGSNNTSLGAFSFLNNSTGNANTIIGTFADVASGNLFNATAIGDHAVVNTSNTIQLGNTSVTDVKTSGNVTALGFKIPNGTASQYLMADGTISNAANSLTGHVTGSMNVAAGNGAMTLSLDRKRNTAVGNNALQSGRYGDDNTAIGVNALQNNGLGLVSSSAASGSFDATHNTAIGAYSLSQNTIGKNNSGLGFNSLKSNTTGTGNSALGADSSKNNTTGSMNTSFGSFSFQNNTTGNANTTIGTFSDVATGNLHNATAIGANAIVTDSNSMQLGDQYVTDVKTSGKITAPGFKIPNGTANQYLMADGSISTTGGNGLTLLGKILYTRTTYDNTTNLKVQEIWTANYDGSNKTKINITLPSGIVFVDNLDPRMTPDGLKIFFMAGEAPNGGYGINAEIYSCNADGSNVNKIILNDTNGGYLHIKGVN